MPTEISANLNAVVSRPAQTPRAQDAHSRESTTAERQPLPPGGQTLPPQQDPGGDVQRRELDEAVSRIQDYVQNLQRELRFSVDEGSGRTIIKVIDSETDKVIRQIPPDELLAISEQLKSDSEGVLLKVQA